MSENPSAKERSRPATVSVYVEPKALRRLRALALQLADERDVTRVTLTELIAEAIGDLLAKYERKKRGRS